MKHVTFSERNRSVDLLHIEVPGAIVNIRIGLADRLGRRVTRVSILADDESRSPDENGYYWRDAGDGRVIRDIVPGLHISTPDPMAWECRFCGADIEQGTDGLWADQSDAWADPSRDDHRDEISRLSCPQSPQRNDLYSGLHEPDTGSDAWRREHPVPEPS